MSIVVINGKTYHGNSVSITNGKVMIDGIEQTPNDVKEITISITGNLDKLHVDHCKEISITGDCGKIQSGSGDVKIQGNSKDIRTGSGDVKIKGYANGDVSTGSGDVEVGGDIQGDASTRSGDIDKKF